MNIKLLSAVLCILILSSCGGSKSAVKDRELKTETIKAIVKNYDKSRPDFMTMRGRLKCEFIDGNNRQSINISYRYKKDEVLWMSAKFAGLIQVAKLMISPKKIQFYERIDQSYFDGDFQLISSFLGLELNYEQLQNLLLGQSIKPIDIYNSELDAPEGYFQINTNYDQGIQQSVLLDEKTFKIKQQVLKLNAQEIKIIYNSYQVIDKMFFPEEMVILANDEGRQVSLILNYKNINLNDNLNFPFRFPDNFKPLKLD
jgi:hypothetical protein